MQEIGAVSENRPGYTSISSAESMLCLLFGVEATGSIVDPGHPLRLESGEDRGQPDRSRDKMIVDVRSNTKDLSFSTQFISAQKINQAINSETLN
jgi:hypothetical protein